MMEKLYGKLCDILDEMAHKGTLSTNDLQIIDWATHAKKSMLAIEEMEGKDRDRSYRGYGQRDRYSARYRGDGREEYLDQLRSMMDSAPDEKMRQSISRMMREIEQD